MKYGAKEVFSSLTEEWGVTPNEVQAVQLALLRLFVSGVKNSTLPPGHWGGTLVSGHAGWGKTFGTRSVVKSQASSLKEAGIVFVEENGQTSTMEAMSLPVPEKDNNGKTHIATIVNKLLSLLTSPPSEVKGVILALEDVNRNVDPTFVPCVVKALVDSNVAGRPLAIPTLLFLSMNPASEGYQTQGIDSAVLTARMICLNLLPEVSSHITGGRETPFLEAVRKAFQENKNSILGDELPRIEGRLCPRQASFLCEVYSQRETISPTTMGHIIVGVFGQPVARSFLAQLSVIEDRECDPVNFHKVLEEGYVGTLSKEQIENLDQRGLVQYLAERLGKTPPTDLPERVEAVVSNILCILSSFPNVGVGLVTQAISKEGEMGGKLGTFLMKDPRFVKQVKSLFGKSKKGGTVD